MAPTSPETPALRVRLKLAVLAWLAACLVALIGHLLLDEPAKHVGGYIELDVATTVDSTVQFYWDNGPGFREEDSSTRTLSSGADIPTRLRFPLPNGLYRRVRLDFSDTISFSGLCLTDRDGRTRYLFTETDISRKNDIENLSREGDRWVAQPTATTADAYLVLTPPKRILLFSWISNEATALAARSVRIGTLLWIACLGTTMLGGWIVPRIRDRMPPRARAFMARPPAPVVILGASVIATLLACYPIVFLDRSNLSPEIDAVMLYTSHPSVPGFEYERSVNVRGADIGAAMWAHYPYSVVQHRALIHDHEIPLWNRYNSCGTSLLGQGQSMLGDPLHALVVLAGASSWAWDAKFVVARILFAFGAGTIAWALTRRLGIACLIAIAAAFIGFFNCRINHPAIFSISYAPWILAGWCSLASAASSARDRLWFWVIILSTIAVLASGTAKEAGMLASSLNLAGLAFVAVSDLPSARKKSLLRLGIITGVSIVLISAPHWLVFLDTLRSSFTLSGDYYATQLPRPWLIGLFDHIFYQQHSPFRGIWGPSANFAMLLGLLLFVTCARSGRAMWLPAVSLVFVVASFGLIYRWIPGGWITTLPLLRNIGHIHNVFSCIALVLMIPPVACGYAAFIDRCRLRLPWVRMIFASLLVAALLYAFFDEILPTWFGNGAETAIWRELEVRRHFLLTAGLLLLGMGGVVTYLARTARSGRTSLAGLLFLTACLIPFFVHHGLFHRTIQPDYFSVPGKRGQLNAHSPAVDWLHARAAPARVVGIEGYVFPGYSGAVGLEGPNGPDALIPRWHRDLAILGRLVASNDWRFALPVNEIDRSRRYFDLFNGEYFVWHRGYPPPVPWLEPAASLDLSIYRNPDAWPRAYFTDVLTSYANLEEFGQLLESSAGRPFTAIESTDSRAPLVLAKPANHEARTAFGARDYHLTNNTTSFTIDAPGPGFVTLLEAWLPESFTVRVNGRKAEYFRANHAFKAVHLPAAGTYRIEFSYWPRQLTLALTLAVGGLTLALITSFRRRPATEPPHAHPLRLAPRATSDPDPMSDPESPNPGCPVCGAAQFIRVREIGRYAILRCQACRVQITYPQPSDEALGEIYGRDYFIGADDPQLQSHASALKRATAARYLALMQKVSPPPGRRLLELGSGHGDFLVEAADNGYEVTGVEYSEHACGMIRARLAGRGTVIQGEIDAIAGGEERFDVCVLNDVIEHVRHPGSLLKTIHGLLAPSGVVFIATPSIESWSARLLGNRWMEYKEEHLTYFGPRQLGRLLLDRGFKVVYRGAGRKVLSLDYIVQHFEHYPVGGVTPVLRLVHRLTPRSWRTHELNIVASGMTVIARRCDGP